MCIDNKDIRTYDPEGVEQQKSIINAINIQPLRGLNSDNAVNTRSSTIV